MAKGLMAFVEIIEADTKNKTQNLILATDVVPVNLNKNGTEVTIGVGGNVLLDIESGKKRAFLILVDAEELKKVSE